MINPFSEDLSIREELREAWKKIEHLEEEKRQLNNENRDLQIENKRLKDKNIDLTKEVMRLGKIILEQEDELYDDASAACICGRVI